MPFPSCTVVAADRPIASISWQRVSCTLLGGSPVGGMSRAWRSFLNTGGSTFPRFSLALPFLTTAAASGACQHCQQQGNSEQTHDGRKPLRLPVGSRKPFQHLLCSRWKVEDHMAHLSIEGGKVISTFKSCSLRFKLPFLHQLIGGPCDPTFQPFQSEEE